MAELEMSVERRTAVGTSQVRKLRARGLAVGVLYGLNQESIPLSFSEAAFEDLLRQGGAHQIVYLRFGNHCEPALLKEVQRHPISRRPLAADFIRVDLSKPVDVVVPVHMTGKPEAELPAEANLSLAVHELLLRGLPTQIPPMIEVDVAPLRLDRPITIADLPRGDYEYVQPEDTAVVVASMPKRALLEAERAEVPAAEPAEAEAPAEEPEQKAET